MEVRKIHKQEPRGRGVASILEKEGQNVSDCILCAKHAKIFGPEATPTN